MCIQCKKKKPDRITELCYDCNTVSFKTTYLLLRNVVLCHCLKYSRSLGDVDLEAYQALLRPVTDKSDLRHFVLITLCC